LVSLSSTVLFLLPAVRLDRNEHYLPFLRWCRVRANSLRCLCFLIFFLRFLMTLPNGSPPLALFLPAFIAPLRACCPQLFICPGNPLHVAASHENSPAPRTPRPADVLLTCLISLCMCAMGALWTIRQTGSPLIPIKFRASIKRSPWAKSW
jgi:hypothetical protein